MNKRKVVGAVALGLLLILSIGSSYIAGVHQDDWGIVWKLIYIVALCVALFMTFYDRKNFPEKTWDFNPRRGVLYFVFGWIIFPIMMVVDALTGADFALSKMITATFVMSVLVGIAGTFTENVGV